MLTLLWHVTFYKILLAKILSVEKIDWPFEICEDLRMWASFFFFFCWLWWWLLSLKAQWTIFSNLCNLHIKPLTLKKSQAWSLRWTENLTTENSDLVTWIVSWFEDICSSFFRKVHTKDLAQILLLNVSYHEKDTNDDHILLSKKSGKCKLVRGELHCKNTTFSRSRKSPCTRHLGC